MEEETVKMFAKHGVLKPQESEARYEMLLENYLLKVQIESRAISDLALNRVIPAAIKYQNTLITNVEGLLDIELKTASLDTMKNLIQKISEHIKAIYENVEQMVEARKKANELETKERALAYDHQVKPYFETIRTHVDKLELLVDDEIWTLTKYREILMVR